MGTTHSVPSPNGGGVDPLGSQQGQAQIVTHTSSSIPPVKKAESIIMAGEVLAQKGHPNVKDALGNTPSESAFMSPSTQNWPKTAPQAKNHSCATEATPISDPALYSKQDIALNSHHFKKAQDFYGGRSSPSMSQPERHPSPVSMGSAARLQAKYGHKVGSAVQPGETQQSYRGPLKPASHSVDPNNNNSNGMSTSPDDEGSNGIPSMSDNVGDDISSKRFLPDQTSSDSRSEMMDHDYYYAEANKTGREKGLIRNPKAVQTDLDTVDFHPGVVTQKKTVGQEESEDVKYAKGTLSTQARRLDKKAEFKHSLAKFSEGENAFTNSPEDVPSAPESEPRVTGHGVTHSNKQNYKVTLSQNSTANGHAHPTQVYSRVTPRAEIESTSPLQRSPRLLDRSTIQRGVNGSLHVRKPTPREKVKSGVATAQDLQDLGNGDVSELDVLISMDDNPYRVGIEPIPESLIKETSPHPSARTATPMSSSVYAPHSPRGRVSDQKRPRSSKRRDSSSPRQSTSEVNDPHALQYFSVSKLSLQNRVLEKSPQPTPRSPNSALHDGPLTSGHQQGTTGSRSGAQRPKAQGTSKTISSGRGGKGKRSPQPRAEKAQDSPHEVVTQGCFMGHRAQPGYLKVQYSKKK